MSEKIFELLLKLYPRCFRDEYGDAARQLLRDRLSAETGIPGRLRLWMDFLKDLAISVPREHRRPLKLASAESGRYRMSEEAIAEMVRRSHIRELPFLFLSIAFGFLIGWLGDAPRWPLCAIYGLLFFLTALTHRGLGRFKSHWRSYELILDDDRIQQKHAGVTLILLKPEVTRLLETRDLGMAILTPDPRKSIWVPSVLNGYEELRDRLGAWVPVEEPLRHAPRVSARGIHPFQWILALYAAALLVRSPYYAIPLAALVAACVLNLTRMSFAPRRKSTAVAWLMSLGLIVPLVVKLAFVLR